MEYLQHPRYHFFVILTPRNVCESLRMLNSSRVFFLASHDDDRGKFSRLEYASWPGTVKLQGYGGKVSKAKNLL